MPRRKVSTTVYLTAQQYEDLGRLNAHTKVPVAEYIRQGVDHILAQHQRLLEELCRNQSTPAEPKSQ